MEFLRLSPERPWKAFIEGGPLPEADSADKSDLVEWARRADEEWVLNTRAASGRLLVLAMTWYEGVWQAEVDGNPARMLPVDGVFTGVLVPGGSHTVRVFYHDPLFLPAWIAFLLGLAGCVALMGWARRQ
jgi:uncharacterized membrane protein YfhO